MSDKLTELPEGWRWTEISEVAELISGQHILSQDYCNEPIGVPYLTGPADFSDRCPIISKWTDKPKVMAQKGDVLITVKGNGVGKTNILNIEEAAISRQLMAIRALHSEPTYFFLFLQANFDNLQRLGTGSTVPGIDRESILAISVPFPPLNEQKRIIAKIEELNDRHQRAKQALEAIPELCDRFRQSVLAAAFRGDLTADWREENPDVEPASVLLERIAKNRRNRYTEACVQAKQQGKSKPRKVLPDEIPQLDCKVDLPETWIVINIEFLAHVTKLAGFEYTKYITLEDAGDVPVVRAQNVQMGKFVKENIKYISQQTSDFLERSQLQGREILMVFIGAGTGNVCLAPSGRWHLAPNVAKLDVDGIDTEYLLTYLQSPVGRNNVLVWAKATAQASLSMETIRQIQVHIPPLEEQKEVVVRLKKLLSFIDTVEQQYGNMKLQFDHLNQSILAKAFRGELVEQDPNDEPASVLLERIRAEREKLQGNKKSGSVRGKRKKE